MKTMKTRDDMSSAELTALGGLTFNWTRTLNDVWAPAPFHVEGLHIEVSEAIGRSITQAAHGAANPLGVVIEGQRGVGKTHLLGWTREQAQRAGGYFFLVGDLSANAFWEELLGCVVEQLLPLPDGSRDQLRALLTALADRTGLDPVFRDATTGDAAPTPVTLRVFIRELRRIDPRIGLICQDTARALVLLASPLQEDQDVGYYFLTGNEVDVEDRRRWGIHATRSVPRLLITELSRLLALTGPTVIAIDQIDALIDELVGEVAPGGGSPGEPVSGSRALADMATGLMTLRDRTFRTLTIVSCLPESWEYILKYGTDTVGDRFNVARQLRNIPSAEIGRLMIEKRFAADYARTAFEPPYPSWPILPGAFADASHYTARALLKRVEAHVSKCLHERTVSELGRLEGHRAEPVAAPAAPADDDFAVLDARFAELRDGTAVDKAAAALHEGTEDTVVPALLAAGLEAWVRERGTVDDQPFTQDPPPGKNPRLHASLRLVLDARTERQRRWAFRAIAASHPRAVQSRLRKAAEAAGLDAARTDRHLFVLRNTPWPTGKVTEQETGGLTAKGGLVLPLPTEDLKTFAALAALFAEHHPDLNAWLQARQPAHSTELLGRALGAAIADQAAAAPEVVQAAETDAGVTSSPAHPEPAPNANANANAVQLSLPVTGRQGVSLDLASLRRHLAVFAGSGSGKTVLLKRIIEECALRGVSSIVLDPNNDLARLGDAWPQQPSPWLSEDAARARDYLENTEVVVWTPRREGGRPLSFRPLPDFGAVLDDIDEFNAAVDAAVEALAPRVGAQRQSQRAAQEKAVLTEAMRYFAQGAGHDLSAFIDLLADLPEDVSTQAKGTEIAAGLADRLRAVRVTDPLFGGTGEAADPGMLLTPAPGKRARVSVISMVGMVGLDQWQGFVNQLQMALFSWVKRNPADDRPLGGLLIMDEAQDLVPSTGTTACSESTRRLASQARKYGLGLLFATQSPKGLHNSISGNATTQFFGLLNAPAQIEAARDLARAKGGDVPDIGRMSAGEFYLATEGSGFQRIRTPMCLSCHAGPLTEDEVLAKSRPSRTKP
jgi:Helicase HerA, central domain